MRLKITKIIYKWLINHTILNPIPNRCITYSLYRGGKRIYRPFIWLTNIFLKWISNGQSIAITLKRDRNSVKRFGKNKENNSSKRRLKLGDNLVIVLYNIGILLNNLEFNMI
jgi:hypothetical protein